MRAVVSTVAGLGRRTTHSYLRYRNSGVEWLGEVPEHWEVKRLAYSVLRSDNAIEPDGTDELPYVGLEHVESWTGRLHPRNGPTESDITSNSFANGEVLFGKLRPYLAKAFSAKFNGLCSTEFLVLKPHGYKQRYLLYLLLTREFVSLVDSSTYGAKMPRANWDIVGQSLLPVPPFDEQRAIATFLDRETERIDSLARKMRLLIERLGEHRTALITRTVTRGLPAEAARLAGVDPSPRLKPSGVEWLGRVPEHWEVKRLKFVTSINDESLSKDEDPLRPIAYVNIGSVNSALGIEQAEEMVFEDAPSRARRLVNDGDTIVSTVRTYLGEIAPVADPRPDMVVSTGFAVIRPRRVDAGFVSWALREGRIVAAIVARSTGVSYPAVNAPEIGELFVTLPPLGEQRAISAFLDRETERIDSLATKMRLLIERLSEYRTALITAAVTGKIDVRASLESPEAHLRSRLS